MVQQLVRNALKDGDSAKFRNQWELCGEVNAKTALELTQAFSVLLHQKKKLLKMNTTQIHIL